MKAISLLITSVFLLSLGAGVFAQETELPDPGLTPDSPFYFLEIISEKIGTFFTFGDIKKAERYVALAAERLAEAQAVAEKGKPKFVEKTLERYEDQLVKALFRVEKADTKGKDTKELAKTITEATQKHLTVLEEILEKVPEEAKPAIERAMIVSTKEGLERAVEELKQKDASGQSFEVFKAKCLESGGPPETCESLVKNLQSSKSLRTLCIEQGGPPEMCEKFPDQRIESFEVLETFCTEMGGSSEICASLEAKCREIGVTTPKECFLVMSIATIETVAVPISEEQMEELRTREESLRRGEPLPGEPPEL